MLNRLFLMMLAIAVIGVLSGAWVLLDQPIKRFKIEGELTVSEQSQVQDLLQSLPRAEGGMLTTDLAGIHAHFRAIDWAHAVTVKREWPDTLIVSLERLIPMAKWGQGQYLTTTGEVVSLPDDLAGLPDFRIQVAQADVALRTYRLIDQLTARRGLSVIALEQNLQGEWQVDFAQGFSVRLGSEQVDQRMERFVAMYLAVLKDSEKTVAYVDMRYGSGAAVRYEDTEVLVADTSATFTGERNGG